MKGSAKLKSESSNSSKKITEIQNENFGNLFLGKSQGGKPTNLNAKKLDIDFDCDDFFNQFDPMAVKKPAAPVQPKQEKVEPESMIKFGSNAPVVEEKPKTNLDEYNSKK